MEFSWTSFILELINFLVLVWILKYFFYNPIQQVLSKRQQAVQDILDKAQNKYNTAFELEQQYENRLQIWEVEKEEKRKIMEQSLQEWKTKKQNQFKETLVKEKEKIQAQQKQVFSSIINQNAKEALLNASKFSAKFLSSFADAELEKKCIEQTLDELETLTTEKISMLQSAIRDQDSIIVKSAYPIADEQKNHLIEHLQHLFVNKTTLIFEQDPNLLAGLEIKIGSFSLKANLRDELAFFAEIKHG